MTSPRTRSIITRTPLLLAALMAACGGGSPLDNPQNVVNTQATGGQKLSFAYFVRCVNPVLNTPLRVNINGVITNNTCAAAGCHDNTSGTGGALRLLGNAPVVDLALAPAVLRNAEIYKNYYSSLGETVVGAPLQSRLLNKPLVRGVLHGGGVVFETPEDAAAKTLRYWINRPMPQGQDEFSSAADSMFTPANALTGVCNSD